MPTSIIRRTAAVAVLTMGSITVLGGPAGAQVDCYPPTHGCTSTTHTVVHHGPKVSLPSTTLTLGISVTVTVSGFLAGTSGIVTIQSVEQQIGSFTMPDSGAPTTASVTIPIGLELGAHTVYARGTLPDGVAGSASLGVTVVTGSTTSTTGANLARTGFAVGAVGTVGVGLVLGGLALKRSGGRRKVRPAS